MPFATNLHGLDDIRIMTCMWDGVLMPYLQFCLLNLRPPVPIGPPVKKSDE